MDLIRYCSPMLLFFVQGYCKQQLFTYRTNKICDIELSMVETFEFKKATDSAIGCVRMCTEYAGCDGTIFLKDNKTCIGIKNDTVVIYDSDSCVSPGATYYKLASVTSVPTAHTTAGPVADTGSVSESTTGSTTESATAVATSDSTTSLGCTNNVALVAPIDNEAQFSASSYYGHPPIEGKLGSIYGWYAATQTVQEYIQVRFVGPKVLTVVATKGVRGSIYNMMPRWVELYKVSISSSSDCSGFSSLINNSGTEKVFYGSFDDTTLSMNSFNPPVVAHCVRINPIQWYGGIGLHFELYGCNY